MKKSMKIDVDVSMYRSVDTLKDSRVMNEILTKVTDILKKQGQKARVSAVEKASKNAVSLLSSKKKGKVPTSLSVYLPMNVVEPLCDTLVPNISSDEDLSVTSAGEDDEIASNSSNSQKSSSSSHTQQISFSMYNEGIKVDMTFDYLLDYFKYSLSNKNRPMNLERILFDICKYVFLELKCSVNIRELKKRNKSTNKSYCTISTCSCCW